MKNKRNRNTNSISAIANDHHGFSLIEVLIAMIILVVAAVPIYRSFVLTARINAGSEVKGQARTVAENVMEGLRMYSLEEIQSFFSDNHTNESDEANNDENESVTVRNTQFPVYGFDSSDGTASLISETEDTFVYSVSGLRQNDVDGHVNLYDARITIDKSNVQDVTLYTMSNFTSGKDYMGSLDSETDDRMYDRIVTYLNTNSDVKSEMIEKVFSSGYYEHPERIDFNDDSELLNFVKANTTRTIRINVNYISLESDEIDEDATSGKLVRVEPEIIYQLAIPKNTRADEDDKIGDSATVKLRAETFQTNASESYPRNIFFRYIPNYNSAESNKTVFRSGVSVPKDVIEIYNPGGVKTTAVLVKTYDGEDKTSLDTAERNYRVRVTVYDNINVSGGISNTRIRTNINENLAKSGLKNSSSYVQLRGYQVKDYKSNQELIKHEPETLAPETDSKATYLYRMTVDIFSHGADMSSDRPLVTLTNAES